MKRRTTIFATGFFLVIFGILPVFGQGEYCLIADPTGTPLNVRSEPNGRILRSVKNETRVVINELKSDPKSRPWSKITLVSDNGPALKSIGWVLRTYLFCGTSTGYIRADSVTRNLEVSAGRSWDNFFNRFRAAMASRDQNALLTMGFVVPDFIELEKNKGRGWKEIDQVLKVGVLQNMIPAEARKYLAIDGSPCGSSGQFSFVVVNGRWQMEWFGIGGCGH